MANSNGWGDGAANNSIGWGQGANNAIAWGDSHAKSWAGATDIVGIDSDAQAFITAAAITDPVQINAINTLVEGMKTDGIWTKMKAVYPFVGGTASTHKWNLKDPRDLDAAFRLVFNGGWTHSANGATPNGTNGYADTKLIPSSVLLLDSVSLSFYSRTNIKGDIQMGVNDANNYLIQQMYSSTQMYSQLNGTGSSFIDAPVTQWQGLFTTTRTSSSNVAAYKNGINIKNDIKSSTARPTKVFYLGARNNDGVAGNYDIKQTAFASIGDGLTDTEAANLYTRVQAFQTALSRQV